MWKTVLFLCILTSHYATPMDPDIEEEQMRLVYYLSSLNKRTQANMRKITQAHWEYETNVTDYNFQKQQSTEALIAMEEKKQWKKTLKLNWNIFPNYYIRRQFKMYSMLGQAVLPLDKFARLNTLVMEMQKAYSNAKVCDFKERSKCDLAIDPDLTQLMTTSRDPEELKYLWLEWRDAIGPKGRDLFAEYLELTYEAAPDAYLLRSFEDATFKLQLEKLWLQLEPFYLQLHAYVRHQLRKRYGEIVSEKGPIPAHLLGDKQWSNVANFTLPKPEKPVEDLTAELKRQNYTVEKMFKTAEDFFLSINLTQMPDSFWERSIFKKPKDREIVCEPSTYDFFDGDDFRIKQCTEVTMEQFQTVHRTVSQVEYLLQYKNQPIKFRNGANPAFHEAVGDLITLSVQSRKHLKMLNLVKSANHDPDIVLNTLFQFALDKIAFLPFAYLTDLWRWDVFAGEITHHNYNCKWWDLREEYQGLEPPVNRNENDFDPASNHDIVSTNPYIRHFVSFVIQFQFHRALCEIAGQYDPNDLSKAPLHECDIYGNTDAGNALKKMLELGSSRPWQDAMEILTGQRIMDATGLLEYFRPLHKWLEDENKKNEIFVGWEKSTKNCTSRKEDNSSS